MKCISCCSKCYCGSIRYPLEVWEPLFVKAKYPSDERFNIFLGFEQKSSSGAAVLVEKVTLLVEKVNGVDHVPN